MDILIFTLVTFAVVVFLNTQDQKRSPVCSASTWAATASKP
ncbi:hypothetical protein [Hydrogenophaga sp.]